MYRAKVRTPLAWLESDGWLVGWLWNSSGHWWWLSVQAAVTSFCFINNLSHNWEGVVGTAAAAALQRVENVALLHRGVGLLPVVGGGGQLWRVGHRGAGEAFKCGRRGVDAERNSLRAKLVRDELVQLLLYLQGKKRWLYSILKVTRTYFQF